MTDDGNIGALACLPDRDIAQVIGFLDAPSRAALRASCKANKAVVDAHVQGARFYGVARHRQEASLPPFIKEAHIHVLGPPTTEWLCKSLGHLQHLTTLHITAERAREEDIIKSQRSPPSKIGVVEMLHHLSTTNLRELSIEDFGLNVRYTREKQWRALLPPKEKVDALAQTLHTLRLTEEYRMYKNIFQCLIIPLVNLRSLDLGGTHLGFLPEYATHELSRMTALSSLRMDSCQAVKSSHVAPLFTITSLKSLGLNDVHFAEDAQEFESTDPLVQPERMAFFDRDTQQFVANLRQLTGWGPQMPLELGTSSAPLQQAGGVVPHPALCILRQLGRCIGLERLAIAGWILPGVDEDEVDESNFAVGEHMLTHLTNLTSLDMDALGVESLPFLGKLPCLKSLSVEITETQTSSVDFTDMLDVLAQTSQLAQLVSLRVPEPHCSAAFGLSSLRQLTAVTNLGLDYLTGDEPWHELTTTAIGAICAADLCREADAPKLQHLIISGWFLPQASIISPLTSLTELDISDTHGEAGKPMLQWLNWPPELFSQLSHLKHLACKCTSFGDDQLVRALTCAPSLQVLWAKGCWISELGVLRATHPGAARASLQTFYRRLHILKHHHADLYAAYMQQQQGLPDMLPTLRAGTDLTKGLADVHPLHVKAPLVELDLSCQSPHLRQANNTFGDASALALAACLPGLKSLSLRECERLGAVGWLALGSMSVLTELDVRRCNIAGPELSALASNALSPSVYSQADACIEGLRTGFCARIHDQHESWLPVEAASEAERLSAEQAGGCSEVAGAAEGTQAPRQGAGSEAESSGTTTNSSDARREQVACASTSGGASPVEDSALGAISDTWIAQLKACVDRSRPMFPALHRLQVTDDRTHMRSVLHTPEVDAVALAVARGICSLKELYVDKAEQDEGTSDTEEDDTPEDGDDDDSSSSGDVEHGNEAQPQLAMLGVTDVEVGSESDRGSSTSSESEWEEMAWGEDKELDAKAAELQEIRKLPPLLHAVNCHRWLEAGLLVQRALEIHEDDGVD